MEMTNLQVQSQFGVMSFNFLSAFSKQWLSYHRPIVQAFLEPTDDMIIMRIEEKATNDNILRFVWSIAGVKIHFNLSLCLL